MINEINHNIDIDLANKINMITNFQIKKNDTNSHKFIINIYNNSLAYNLTGLSAKIYFQKADNTKVFSDCTIDDALNGKISCILSTQCLSYAGVVAAEITIFGTNNEVLTSITFNFSVVDTIRDDNAIQSTNEFTALTQALVKVDAWDAQFQTKYDGLEAQYATDLTEVKTSLNDIPNQINNAVAPKANQVDLDTQKGRIDNLVSTSSSSYYEKTTSGTAGALLVVSSGATTGQINLSSVTPVAIGYTPVVGDYVRLVYGVASGSTELIDLRTDIYGYTFSTVGNAVRKQINTLNSAADIQGYISQDVTYVANARGTDGATTNPTGFHIDFAVSEGDVLKVSGNNYQAAYPLYVLLNSSGGVVSYYTDSTNEQLTDISVTIPKNVATISVNCFAKSTGAIKKLTKTKMSEIIDTDTDYHVEDIAIGFGYAQSDGSFHATLGYHGIINVKPGDQLKLSGSYLNANYPLGWYSYKGTITGSITGGAVVGYIYDYAYTVPNGVDKIYINSDVKDNLMVKRNKKRTVVEQINVKLNNKARNKTIVWFGTSIPAGCYNSADSNTSYPMIIASMLGANVINEAISSSPVHCRQDNLVDASTNPYGFKDNYKTCAYALAGSLAEKEWLITNYQSSIFTSQKYTTMTDSDKEYIRNCSYERKLDKYLTASNFPDLFVFDHGRNDMFSYHDWNYSSADQFSLFNFQGAMNFLINRILAFNPKAKIIIIGHYTNQARLVSEPVQDFPTQITTSQQAVADDWELPIFKLWEKTGWSQKQITNNSVTKTVLNWWLPDDLHPHSDTSGKAIKHIANLIAPFIRDNIG
ncbi:BppU family phage baseplate upper protein [Clostridium omnivorum]|uniref:BppU N-terminal domain-containing protein n=1 Tax=Clostridium omnivorum TaxID=1604902 RepID=A0ABQ5NCD1_9CLOT|nr:BppU family phage baseplate upper protein [Clostridium sp. E14]GLC32925.1 hypothetical protein bsdE14_43350 [Clostridium sp. E14]